MEIALHLMVFELGSEGVAFTGHVFAPLRQASQCHAKLSMEWIGVFPPTVDSLYLIVASIVSLLVFHIISCYIHSSLVDLSRIHHDALLASDYQHLPIRKSHVHDIVAFCWYFNPFCRTWRISKHGGDPVHIFEWHCIGGITLCCGVLWGVMQQAGPRRIPCMSNFLYFVTPSHQ